MPRVLITGASSGIGAELAKLFAQHGYELILTARDEQRLREIGGAAAKIIVADLSDPATPERIHAAAGEVDVLVNNAGFGLLGRFATTDLTTELKMIQVNVTALVHLTKLLLPAMLAKNSGRVLNVASTAGFFPGPNMAVYYATKAFVVSFSEALSGELEGTEVTVTALCPGPTATRFGDTAGMKGTKLFQRGTVMTAADVARAGFDGLLRGRRLVIPGITNKLLVQSARFAPRSLILKISKSLTERVRTS
jgi:short-subunit dehydrogenase